MQNRIHVLVADGLSAPRLQATPQPEAEEESPLHTADMGFAKVSSNAQGPHSTKTSQSNTRVRSQFCWRCCSGRIQNVPLQRAKNIGNDVSFPENKKNLKDPESPVLGKQRFFLPVRSEGQMWKWLRRMQNKNWPTLSSRTTFVQPRLLVCVALGKRISEKSSSLKTLLAHSQTSLLVAQKTCLTVKRPSLRLATGNTVSKHKLPVQLLKSPKESKVQCANTPLI